MTKKVKTSIKAPLIYASYLVVVWGIYRYFLDLPNSLEEFLIKPAVWLIPLFYLVFKNKEKIKSLGITSKNLFPALYLSIALGSVFAIEALLVNFFKYDGFNFSANIGQEVLYFSLLISFATALTEEISFRGYIFTRLLRSFKSEIKANLVTTFFWVLIHVPVVFFVIKADLISGAIYLLITAIFGIGSAFVFARTGNVFSSVLLHVLWEWPIILFR